MHFYGDEELEERTRKEMWREVEDSGELDNLRDLARLHLAMERFFTSCPMDMRNSACSPLFGMEPATVEGNVREAIDPIRDSLPLVNMIRYYSVFPSRGYRAFDCAHGSPFDDHYEVILAEVRQEEANRDQAIADALRAMGNSVAALNKHLRVNDVA